MISLCTKFKRGFALIIITIFMITQGTTLISQAAQSNLTGTQAALGSPLLSSNFVVDDWDPWEMLCFGIFLSNFCQPFEDDYASAFTEGSTIGTQGRGLKALQFSAGGDASTAGYLHDMVEYCKSSQQETYRNIYVDYSWYEYNEEIAIGLESKGGTRQAYLDDLLPKLYDYDDTYKSSNAITVWTNNQMMNPIVAYSIRYISSELLDKVSIVQAAALPQFYASKDGSITDETLIFDMSDNWDIQMLKAIFAKTFNKKGAGNYAAAKEDDENGMDSAIKDALEPYLGRKCPLVMDTYGNICMQYQGRNVIVVPSSANQHITAENSYNYLNSLVLNNFVLSETESTVVANAQTMYTSETSGYFKRTTKHNVGNFPIAKNDKSKITDGKLLIHSDTDTQLFQTIYKILKEGGTVAKADSSSISASEENGNITFGYVHNKSDTDIISGLYNKGYGKIVGDLVSEDAFYQQAIQFDITGASSTLVDTTNFLLSKSPREQNEINVETCLGAYGLLSSLFAVPPVVDKANTLDYMYAYESDTNLESTKQSLFGDSYYITPRISTDDSLTKLYVNMFMQVLQGSLDIGLTNDERNAIWNTINSTRDFKEVSIPFIGTSDLEYTVGDSIAYNQITTNKIYKNFYEKYFYFRENKNSVSLMNSVLTPNQVYDYFDIKKPKVEIAKVVNGDVAERLKDGVSRVCRIYKPSQSFKALASVFGLEDSCQFELYSGRIYITYLEFYGFLGGNDSSENNFNEKLFDGAYFKDFTNKNFKNGMTAEQRDEAVKLNVFKLLSLDDDGASYRKKLFESFVKSYFVEPLDDKLNLTSVGNIGVTTGFLDVSSLEDNVLIGDFVTNYWSIFSLILFGGLSLIAIFSGALNHRSIGWYITILVSSVTLVYSIPYYLDITPITIEKYINTHFDVAGSYWALAESIQLDRTTEDLANTSDDSMAVVSMLNTLNFLDTDSTLMTKLDISQKVISVTSVDVKSFQRLKTARWLLPSLMQQMSSTSDNYDYVSVPVTRMNDNFAKLWLMYHPQADYVPSSKSGSVDGMVDIQSFNNYDVGNKKSYWTSTDENLGYLDTSASVLSASNTTKSITRLANNQPTHTCYYLLKDLSLESAYAEIGNKGLNSKQWEEYAEKIVSRTFRSSQLTNSFTTLANQILSNLNTYNQYSSSISQEFGYLWTTENLGPYFYLVAKDTFETDEDYAPKEDTEEGGTTGESDKPTTTTTVGKNLAYLALQLQGSTAINENGEEVRTSFMHYGDTGYLRDFCDMEEVFTNVMPYLYQTMIVANGTSDHNGILGSDKMIGNPYYSENYMSWIFRSNWITKIYEDSLYHSKDTVIARDENGEEIGKYTVENISDPRSYPTERPMVFSEAQMHEQHLTEKDLTFTEVKILQFNQEVCTRWTTLINYVNMSGLEKEHIYRQMSMEALFAFNQTFTRDNIIISEKTLYPLNYDLRKLSLITILRSLTSNLTKNSGYMYNDLAMGLYDTYGFGGYLGILVIYWSFLGFAAIRDMYMVFAFISAIVTLIFNFATTSTEKFKSMFGWIITSVLYGIITVSYYFIINFLIGNPTPDSLVNINKLTSTRLTGWNFGLWSIFIIILTLIYAGIIVTYFYQLWIGHKFGLNVKDGGFGFYYSMTDKVVGAVKDMAGKAGKHLSGIHDGLAKFGPGYEPEQNKKGRTKTDAKLDGGKAGSYQESKKKKATGADLQGTDMNSNFNSGQTTDGANLKVNQNIQNTIETGKQIDSLGIDSKIQATMNNIMSAAIDFNANPINWSEHSGVEDLQQIARQASDSYLAYSVYKAKHLHDGGNVGDSDYKSYNVGRTQALEVFKQAKEELKEKHSLNLNASIDRYAYENNGFAGGTIEKMYGNNGGIRKLEGDL